LPPPDGLQSLDWPGCVNARDLGWLPGIRPGALFRSGRPDTLTAEGWATVARAGVRTIVDLRNDDELGFDAATRPPVITTVHTPVDGVEHSGFWEEWGTGPQFGTPLYYGPHIASFPELSAAALRAIARAEPGGVLVHCQGGRDRSGMIAMLALALCDVPAELIAADYELSPPEEGSDEFLAREHGTTAAEVIARTLDAVDARALLGAEDAAALRQRIVDS
jgi:hypothetical protein